MATTQKETNGSKAARVIFNLLTENPDGLERKAIEELGEPMELPRNRVADSVTRLWFTLALQRKLGRRLAFKVLRDA